MDQTSTSVENFYDNNAEREHVRLVENRLEYEISLEVILQTIETLQVVQENQDGVQILDLGGGTGRYSVALASRGHEVTLADVSAVELSQAASHAAEQNVRLSAIIQVDARHVRSKPEIFKPNRYDIILCQGPLYHILERSERDQILQDCWNMLKNGGYLIAAFITKLAHLRDIARKDPRRLLGEKDFYEDYLKTGCYVRNPQQAAGYHTDGDEIVSFFEEFNNRPAWTPAQSQLCIFGITRIVGCEGFLGGGLSSSFQHLSDEELRPWLDLTISQDRQAALLSDHILVVAEKKFTRS